MLSAHAIVVGTAIVCALSIGCGVDVHAPSAPVRSVVEASPSEPDDPPAGEAALRPPPGAPTVDRPSATFWTDPDRGLVLRAARTLSASHLPEQAAWGEVTVLARDRSAPGHLVREWDGDLYWVEYRRADARCDFVRLASGASAPEVLFEDELGDFSETVCETALAIDASTQHLFWIHGSEIHAAAPVRGAPRRVLARGQPFPREIATDETHVYWLALGADPYEDDLTGRGSLRAAPKDGGRVRVLADGLTEPHGLVITGTHVELREDGEQLRQYVRASPPITP